MNDGLKRRLPEDGSDTQDMTLARPQIVDENINKEA